MENGPKEVTPSLPKYSGCVVVLLSPARDRAHLSEEAGGCKATQDWGLAGSAPSMGQARKGFL